MDHLNYKIIEALPSWADKYRIFCQKTYTAAYVRPDLGITKDLFSKEVFNSQAIVDYFNNLFKITANHKVWLALDNNNCLIGGVVAHRYVDICVMKSFYVAPVLQGQGIGHDLYKKVLNFSGSLPIQVDVLKYMQSTIDMYKHWGFTIDSKRGEIVYDWDEWPEKARVAYKGIYMTRSAGFA